MIQRLILAVGGVMALLLWPLCTVTLAVAPSADELSLREVIETALVENPGIRSAIEQLRLGQGELFAARAPFAPGLSATVSRSRTSSLSVGSGGLAQATESDVQSTDYSVVLTQQLRSGLTLQPSITVNQVTSRSLPDTLSTASVNLDLTLPLLRNRWGKVTNNNELAAEEGVESDFSLLAHQRASSLLEAVAAYWDYVSAFRRLDVYRLSTERAQTLVEETRQLVEAEERPAADLNQVEGNVATKQIELINAEQQVVVARRRLGVAMGIPADQIPLLGQPVDDFPAISSALARHLDGQRLIESALADRADLDAARRALRIAELLLDAAKESLKPRLDLVVSTGYTGYDEGSGADRLLTALYRSSPGVNGSVLLDYQFPLKNLSGQATVMQRSAALEQQRIATDDLARRISAAVTVACGDLQRSALAAETAEHAVTLSRTTVENEKEKNRLGVATLFDVILAEDRLTSALLNRVASYRSYAVAVVSLRYETGLLVHGRGGDATVDAQELLIAP